MSREYNMDRASQLVQFETAKIARKKGFDYSDKYGIWIYDEDGSIAYTTEVKYKTDKYKGIKIQDVCILAPTQSLLQKWLREKHTTAVYCIPFTLEEEWSWVCLIDGDLIDPDANGVAYEEALEEGLKEALKLVK